MAARKSNRQVRFNGHRWRYRASGLVHYALCATLDDVILSQSWGTYSVWARHGMVWTFHQDATRGDRFFDILAHLQRDPGPNAELLRLMHLCLSTGFKGRLRLHPQHLFEHGRVRDEVYRLLRGEPMSELSPHWIGIDGKSAQD